MARAALTAYITSAFCGQDNDSDYECPQDEEEGDDRYICAVTEEQTDEQEDSDNEEDNRLPSSAGATRPPRPPRGAHLQDGHSRGDRQKPVEKKYQRTCCFFI